MKEVKKLVPKQMRKDYNKTVRLYVWKAFLQFFYMPVIWFQKEKIFAIGNPDDLIKKPGKWHPYWWYDCWEYLHKGNKVWKDKDGKPKLSFNNCTYGDDNYLIRKDRYGGKPGSIKKTNTVIRFFWMCDWLFRNNWWNGKKEHGRFFRRYKPVLVESLINEPADESPMRFRNNSVFGKQVVLISFNHFQTFRASRTEPLKKYSPLRLFGYRYVNQQLGAANDRYLKKIRYFK